jgi:hypothetical protein
MTIFSKGTENITIFFFKGIFHIKEENEEFGWYRLSAYFLGKCTSELPLILIQPFFFVTVVYWCIGLNGFVAFLSCEFESRSWQGVLDSTLFDKVCQ